MFSVDYYERLDGLIPPDVCRLVFDYVKLRHATGTMLAPDQRVEVADRLYCDMLTETLLAQLQPRIEAVLQLRPAARPRRVACSASRSRGQRVRGHDRDRR